MAEPASTALCLLVGAWSALDGSAVGHFLISRPIVSATLAGAALGDPGSGFLVGVLLEGVYLGGIPAGGARLPEPGPAAVVATFAYARLASPGGLAVALAVGVATAALGGLTVIAQRLANGAITQGVAATPPERRALARAHWTCIGLDASRGLGVTGIGVLAVTVIPDGWAAGWPLGGEATIALFALPSALAVGSLLREWVRTRTRVVLFLAGCVGGAVLAFGT